MRSRCRLRSDAITAVDDESGAEQRRELAAPLTVAAAAADDQLVAAALKVLELGDPTESQPGKYRALLHDNKGAGRRQQYPDQPPRLADCGDQSSLDIQLEQAAA